jgi:acyl carrier protein
MNMTDFESSMRTILGELMGIPPEELSSAATFSELGMDSLVGLRFAKKIQQLYGIEIEFEWIFDYPTIGALSAHLAALPVAQNAA